VQFFANGQEIRSYRIKDLVQYPRLLPHSVSHFTWQEAGELDDNTLTYSLTTKQGDKYVFDVRTGEVLRSFRPFRWAAWFLLVVLVTAALTVWVFWKRKKKPQPLGTTQSREGDW
jgi:hypothetical protein